MTDRTRKYYSHRDRRQVRLAQLFAEATKRGIDHAELRDTIAPLQIGKRLSNASEIEISRLIRYIGGEKTRTFDKPLMSGFRERYDELGVRDGMATPAQLRKIEASWMNVSRMPNHTAREKALLGFLKRICGVQQMEWVEDWMVQKILNAIQHMKR